MPKQLKQIFTLSLLALSLTLLVGCDQAPHRYCPSPVRADRQTKDWLNQVDTPPFVLDYLNRIGRQQEAIEANCYG